MHLFSGNFNIYLGGIIANNEILPHGVHETSYQGCIGEARIGGLLLSYFSHSSMYIDSFTPRDHFELETIEPSEGCILCFAAECKNDGFCKNETENYSCECPAGYAEDDCSSNIDECLTAECTNNSTCLDGIAKYTCLCLPGYDGILCEMEINECQSNPCHNGGTCTDLLANFTCECTDDYAGQQCDVLRLVTCENLPCRNGSTCVDGFNSSTGNNFTCLCSSGLLGAFCDVAFCEAEPCENGGFCATSDSISPFCQCNAGYTGKRCEINIDECRSQPCQNGGACLDLIAGYKCNCTSTGFEGDTCDIDIDECSRMQLPCGGKGLCLNTLGSFKYVFFCCCFKRNSNF